MFGLTGYIRRTADRLAARGFLAIVPDFHHRTAPGFSGVADEAGRAQGYALLNRLDRAADAWRRIDALLAAELLDAEGAEPGHGAAVGEPPAPSVPDGGDAPASGSAGTAG